MKVAIAQINVTIGDFAGNKEKILENIGRARDSGADLVVFPELAVCGYPARDLLEKPSFIHRNLQSVEEIASRAGDIGVVLGYVSINETAKGKGLFNSAGFLQGGMVRFVQHKTLLPEYDVFDEARHFEPARKHEVYDFAGIRMGLTLCEDLWCMHSFGGRRLYNIDPAERLAEAGAQLILNLSASPFTLGKHAIRRKLVCDEAKSHGCPIIYCNVIGGNDELVFDGRSFACDADGRLIAEAKAFEEDLLIIELGSTQKEPSPRNLTEMEEVAAALKLGLRDYMRKCGFDKVVIGLSGGIDSAVVAAVAADALGGDRVLGVLMPSPYTSGKSTEDAELVAKNLGIRTSVVRIDDIYKTYRVALGYDPAGRDVSLAEENIQARIRGNILMAISNRDGALVLSTGNKSELSVGYCTLYGDMAGGLALISDIPKCMVYKLARHMNAGREIIPRSIIDKPPSAELKPDQSDQDSLPPYDVLDAIMRAYIEERKSSEVIVADGFDKASVERVVRLIDTNEYKRRQAAPGIKITSKAFGLGRRFPIAWKP